ncbi:uncharacterized protein LOC142101542 [Mixophyes fleayi]|uniref:uncharacterized protein LOC142101542 n=1 Tax=Mixophyes fleayi TaxID=3061075 RepID=UPI003F4DC2D2
MTPVTMTFLLLVAGLLCYQTPAQHLEPESGIRQEKEMLVLKSNVMFHEMMNISRSDTRQTSPPSSNGKKVTIVLKKVNKERKSLHTGPQNVRNNLCGDKCCPGWNMAPKSGTCTRAVCTPRCKNRGVCRKPQKCVCKVGFDGSYCERRSSSSPSRNRVPTSTPPSVRSRNESSALKASTGDLNLVTLSPVHFNSPLSNTLMTTTSAKDALPSAVATNIGLKSRDDQTLNSPAKTSTSLSWQPLTVQELQYILQKKGLVTKDKMATLLTKHLETQKSQMAKESWKEKHRTPNTIRTARGEFNIHRQIQKNGEQHTAA